MIKLTIFAAVLLFTLGGVGVADAVTPTAQVQAVQVAEARIANGGGIQVGSGDVAP